MTWELNQLLILKPEIIAPTVQPHWNTHKKASLSIEVSQLKKKKIIIIKRRKLPLSLNQTQLKAHLFGSVSVTPCQPAWQSGSTGHMCHQLSVWAAQNSINNRAHHHHHHPVDKRLNVLQSVEDLHPDSSKITFSWIKVEKLRRRMSFFFSLLTYIVAAGKNQRNWTEYAAVGVFRQTKRRVFTLSIENMCFSFKSNFVIPLLVLLIFCL